MRYYVCAVHQTGVLSLFRLFHIPLNYSILIYCIDQNCLQDRILW